MAGGGTRRAENWGGQRKNRFGNSEAGDLDLTELSELGGNETMTVASSSAAVQKERRSDRCPSVPMHGSKGTIPEPGLEQWGPRLVRLELDSRWVTSASDTAGGDLSRRETCEVWRRRRIPERIERRRVPAHQRRQRLAI